MADAVIVCFIQYSVNPRGCLPSPLVLLPMVEVKDQTATPVVRPTHSQPLPINCLVAAATVASVDQLVVSSQQFLLSRSSVAWHASPSPPHASALSRAMPVHDTPGLTHVGTQAAIFFCSLQTYSLGPD